MIKKESEISIQRSSVVGRPTWVNDDSGEEKDDDGCRIGAVDERNKTKSV